MIRGAESGGSRIDRRFSAADPDAVRHTVEGPGSRSEANLADTMEEAWIRFVESLPVGFAFRRLKLL